jgi:hypothetical protein
VLRVTFVVTLAPPGGHDAAHDANEVAAAAHKPKVQAG